MTETAKLGWRDFADKRVALMLGGAMAYYLPSLVVPPIVARLRHETQNVILPGEEEDLRRYLEERRQYHRKVQKDGRSKIVKVRDDILSAARYAYMMRRSAMPKVEDEPDLPDHYAADYDPLQHRLRSAYDPLRGG